MLSAHNDAEVKEEILAAFGPQLKSRPEVLERLVSFANIFNVRAEDLHAKWEAYMINQKSEEDLAIPTLEHLEDLQSSLLRQQENDKRQRLLGTTDTFVNIKEENPFDAPRTFNKDSLEDFLKSGTSGDFRTPAKVKRKIMPKDGAIIGANAGRFSSSKTPQPSLGTSTPKTPASYKRFDNGIGDAMSPIASRSFLGGSPATPSGGGEVSFSSPGAPSPSAVKFADRLNKAKKEEILNDHVPAHNSSPDDPVRCEISLVPGQQTAGYRYMYEKLMEKGDYLDERIDTFAELIGESVRETLPEEDRGDFCIQHPGVPKQEMIVTAGRICCDSLDENAKLNEKSVLLEASRTIGAGCRVKLDLSQLPAFTLFPGQIIGVEGMNSSGRQLNVTRLFQPPLPPKATSAPSQLLSFYPQDDAASTRPINVIVANGPYTLEDSLNYEPLEDFVTQMEKDAPDVVILQGPFVDASHRMIAEGEVDADLDEIFRSRVSSRVKRILRSRKDGSTKVVLIPSTRDACSEWVSFPQPSLAAGLNDQAALARRVALGIPGEVMLFPNPVQFTINETVFACCSTDILWQMAAEEVVRVTRQTSSNPGSNSTVSHHKVTRLFQHILSQRSFYPMFPPAIDDACLDLSRSAALELQATPDVLIVGSKLQYTARKVEGCVCINPGVLVKGRVGGTFAKICVWPLELEGLKRLVEEKIGGDMMDVDGEEEGIGHSVEERCRVEIQRI